MITNEEIHNIYLHQSGVAEGLSRAGADADFPVMFANALLEFYELNKMNNEPRAWWARDRDTGAGYITLVKPTRMNEVAHEYLPLYTHPVKELTDEEILEVIKERETPSYMNFARAILRKAQK